jgi:hypothetical protein
MPKVAPEIDDILWSLPLGGLTVCWYGKKTFKKLAVIRAAAPSVLDAPPFPRRGRV